MLRNIGVKSFNLKKTISDLYKSNARLLARLMEITRKKEIMECRKEKKIILDAYKSILSEASRVALDNMYSEIEKSVFRLVPKLKLQEDFITEIIGNELDILDDIDLGLISISTGSPDFFYIYEDVFDVDFDEGLGESLLVVRYKGTIKTIDFSIMNENIIMEIKLCRKKHLSMIDAMKMKL